MLPESQAIHRLQNSTDPGDYYLEDIVLEILSERLAIFNARLCGPEGEPVWARAWLSNAIEGGLSETATGKLKGGQEVRLELPLESESIPELACIRIESKPYATEQVRCIRLGLPRRYYFEGLVLEPNSPETMLTRIEQMPPDLRAEVSESWLELLRATREADPWVLGFRVSDQDTDSYVGDGGFKGPPQNGTVEIAYGVEPSFQGKGIGTKIAKALVRYAFGNDVKLVLAHTLPETNASTKILTKCGFQFEGEVQDPEDGTVFRWALPRQAC